METRETERFVRIGRSYVLIVLGIALLLPLAIGFVITLVMGDFDFTVALMMSAVAAFIVWLWILMSMAWGGFLGHFVKKTKKQVPDLPYHFNSSFESRGGILYIDTDQGMIGFISAYNPFEVQIFSASRIDNIRSAGSAMSGYRFEFRLDGKKISMPTLITNKIVTAKSREGSEAISKADTFVSLLAEAKMRAGERQAGGRR